MDIVFLLTGQRTWLVPVFWYYPGGAFMKDGAYYRNNTVLYKQQSMFFLTSTSSQ